jgi:hypothetical protein
MTAHLFGAAPAPRAATAAAPAVKTLPPKRRNARRRVTAVASDFDSSSNLSSLTGIPSLLLESLVKALVIR